MLPVQARRGGDTNHFNVAETSLDLGTRLLGPLEDSACARALVFVDACAESVSRLVEARDVLSDLDPHEVESFLDSAWYLGGFLSWSPGEKSYPAASLGHGI